MVISNEKVSNSGLGQVPEAHLSYCKGSVPIIVFPDLDLYSYGVSDVSEVSISFSEIEQEDIIDYSCIDQAAFYVAATSKPGNVKLNITAVEDYDPVVADWQKILRSITYDNDGSSSKAGERKVTLTLVEDDNTPVVTTSIIDTRKQAVKFIPENSTEQYILSLKETDTVKLDLNEINKNLLYEICEEKNKSTFLFFSINDETGEVFLTDLGRRQLQPRDRKPLVVTAQDGHGNSADVDVLIKISKEHSGAVLEQSQYEPREGDSNGESERGLYYLDIEEAFHKIGIYDKGDCELSEDNYPDLELYFDTDKQKIMASGMLPILENHTVTIQAGNELYTFDLNGPKSDNKGKDDSETKVEATSAPKSIISGLHWEPKRTLKAPPSHGNVTLKIKKDNLSKDELEKKSKEKNIFNKYNEKLSSSEDEETLSVNGADELVNNDYTLDDEHLKAQAFQSPLEKALGNIIQNE